jgi:hypothetical protein
MEAAILSLVKLLYTQCISAFQVVLSATVAVTKYRSLASYYRLRPSWILLLLFPKTVVIIMCSEIEPGKSILSRPSKAVNVTGKWYFEVCAFQGASLETRSEMANSVV